MIARLVAMPQREIIAQASFERREPAPATDVPASLPPLTRPPMA